MAFAQLSLKWRRPGEQGWGGGKKHIQVKIAGCVRGMRAQGPSGRCLPGQGACQDTGCPLRSKSRAVALVGGILPAPEGPPGCST